MRYSKVLMTGAVVVMIAALTLTSAGAQAEPPPVGEVEPQDAPIEVDAMVVPVSPVYEWVYSVKPVFTFLRNHKAILYRIQVREYGSATILYTFNGVGTCTDYVCSLKPDTRLNFAGAEDSGEYEWHVAYKESGDTLWHVYSAWEPFIVYKKGFNSTFDLNYKDWHIWTGPWMWNAVKGWIWTIGDVARYNSMYYSYHFPYFDYTVRMKRKVNTNNTNGVMVWGRPSPLSDSQIWDSGYLIHYRNTGEFGIWGISEGDWTSLLTISDCPQVKPYGWNEIRVVGIYPYLDIWLNGVYIGYVTVSTPPAGYYLGFDVFTTGDTDEKFMVDWAKAKVPDLSAAMVHDPAMELHMDPVEGLEPQQ